MEILQTLRSSILMAFRALPLLLISFIAFLAIGLGNLGLFVLFLGHALVVPASTELMHLIIGRIAPPAQDNGLYSVTGSDVTKLVPGFQDTSKTIVAPSYWMAHVLFFLSYLLSNAAAIKAIPRDPKQSDYLYENRQAKANAVITITVIGAVLLSALRYYMTGGGSLLGGAETFRGIVIAFLVSGGLGAAWYQFAAKCGARHADVFGVVPAIVPVTAKDEKAMACVFAPKP